MMHKRGICLALLSALTLTLSAAAESQSKAKTEPAKAKQAEATQSSKKSSGQELNSDAKALDVLRQLEQRYANIRTISGEFDQERFDPTFEEKIASHAKFYVVKPDRFRADYLAPHESTNLIMDQYSYRYVPQLKQVERYHFQNRNTVQDLNFMLLGFGVRTEDLLKVYAIKWQGEVAKGYVGIQLLPLNRKNASFKSVRILLTNDENHYPAQFALEQLDGVRTTANLNLGKLQIGANLDERRLFRPDFPRDAKIVDMQ